MQVVVSNYFFAQKTLLYCANFNLNMFQISPKSSISMMSLLFEGQHVILRVLHTQVIVHSGHTKSLKRYANMCKQSAKLICSFLAFVKCQTRSLASWSCQEAISWGLGTLQARQTIEVQPKLNSLNRGRPETLPRLKTPSLSKTFLKVLHQNQERREKFCRDENTRDFRCRRNHCRPRIVPKPLSAPTFKCREVLQMCVCVWSSNCSRPSSIILEGCRLQLN